MKTRPCATRYIRIERMWTDGPDDWLYHYDKILVEQVVRHEPTLAATVLRLPQVYGSGDKQHRLFPHVKRMDDGRPAILVEDSQAPWCWTRGYVANVAAAIALAVRDDRAAGRIYNLGEPTTLTERAWVQRIGETCGWNGAVVPLPRDQLPAHLRQEVDWGQHLLVDAHRIRRELGYTEPVTTDEAILRTVTWERAHPPDPVDPALFDYAAEDAALAEG